MAKRCEDYPCCGHTPDDPCDAVIPDYSTRENQIKYHIGCDHNTGYCEYEEPDDDDEAEDSEENEDADFDIEEYDERRRQDDDPISRGYRDEMDEQAARLNALRWMN